MGSKLEVVCVTGAAGFIGSWLVMRLLERGYKVRATVRDPANMKKVKHLLELPGAKTRLSLWKADLDEEGSFDEAIQGCTGVFHLATPMDFESNDPENEVIKPAIKGMVGVMKACLKANVRRVVFTSSAGTVNVAEHQKLILDETCWSDVEFGRRTKMTGWEADLVLGGDDGKECTYSKGYMIRQAIFSCITYTPDGNAGVCTACSLSCHDGHQIVELWTKRNFRCDCGNSQFGEFFCKIFPNKDVENVENSYNHNFKGLYCTCGRRYPDPDAEEQVEVIQCCLCEDWFHEEHLGLESSDEIPRDDEGEPLYEGFICKACSEVCSFLKLYPEVIWAARKQPDGTVQASKDKGVLEDEPSTCGSEKPTGDTSSYNYPKTDDAQAPVDSESISGVKRLPEGGNCDNSMALNQCIKSTNLHVNCLLGVNLVAAYPVSIHGKPMFLSKNWRDALCKCKTCLEFYDQKRIAFLLDKEDSIAEYEKMAKQKREEKLQQLEGAELSFL